MFASENVESLKRLSDENLVRLAVAAGAKLHRFDPEQLLVPESPRVVLDQEAEPRLYYAFFPTQRAAALAYCVTHKVPIVQMPGYPDFDTARGLQIDYGGSTVIDQGWR